MPLPRRVIYNRKEIETLFEVHVYDTHIKEVSKRLVFTGTCTDAAKFLSCTDASIRSSLRHRGKVKGRYAIRIKSATDDKYNSQKNS